MNLSGFRPGHAREKGDHAGIGQCKPFKRNGRKYHKPYSSTRTCISVSSDKNVLKKDRLWNIALVLNTLRTYTGYTSYSFISCLLCSSIYGIYSLFFIFQYSSSSGSFSSFWFVLKASIVRTSRMFQPDSSLLLLYQLQLLATMYRQCCLPSQLLPLLPLLLLLLSYLIDDDLLQDGSFIARGSYSSKFCPAQLESISCRL